jgi:hypothetical protein
VTDASAHWDSAYGDRGPAGLSWYEPTPRVSLEVISSLAVPSDAPIIDIGGGASQLADELVARGHTDVTVLDLSEVALQDTRSRLDDAARLIHADVLAWQPQRPYLLWHDRAVLHFFTDDRDRHAYLRTLNLSVVLGGFVVLGVFAPDGPERCSGLPVQRYAPYDLRVLLGDDYVPRIERYDVHLTPTGVRQPFTWMAFERRRSRR